MNGTELPSRSIFDIIEEKKETPISFTWSTSPNDLSYNSSDILTEGILVATKKKGEPDKYILTLQGLYKCKVSNSNILVG